VKAADPLLFAFLASASLVAAQLWLPGPSAVCRRQIKAVTTPRSGLKAWAGAGQERARGVARLSPFQGGGCVSIPAGQSGVTNPWHAA